MDIKTIEVSSRQSMINLYKEMKSVCESYSCELCDICPLGDFYKASEEGIEGYNEYEKQIKDYNQVILEDSVKINTKR